MSAVYKLSRSDKNIHKKNFGSSVTFKIKIKKINEGKKLKRLLALECYEFIKLQILSQGMNFN